MADPNSANSQNILPVQALFNVDGSFNTFIGQGQPFTATINPNQSGLHITNSTIDSTTIGFTTPSTAAFSVATMVNPPAGAYELTNKQYVDSLVGANISWKPPANYGTTANITLSGLGTQGGGDWTSSLTAGMRILVKNQSTAANNGIYVASSSTWTRATDADTWDEYISAILFIESGATLAGTAWYCPAQPGGTLGSTPIYWSTFSLSAAYLAGTGLSLFAYTFSISDTGVTAATYGTASTVPVLTVNAQGQLTTVTTTPIAINGNQITSGTVGSAYISGSYTGITAVGTLTAGVWNGSTVTVPYGGTGATTLTGYVKGNGTSAFTASTTVPTTDLSGTISNSQLQNSTISGVALGSNLNALTIGSGLSGTSYNGSAPVTITNSAPMVYPAAGIPSSTGTAWNTSYSTTGTGTVLALATGPTLNNPTISNYESYTPNTAPTYQEGRVWYDSSVYALSYYNNTTNNIVHIGQELQQQVRNSTGSTILKGQVVYISGSTGQIGNVILAQANSYNASQVIGVANQDIANNTNGWIVTQGTVTGFDTSTFTAGNPLYLSATTAGALTQTEPSTPNYSVHMGVCLYSNVNNGKIYINPINRSIDTGYIIGQVAIAQGGTNGTATPTAGAVAYGSGTAYAFTSAGTSGQVLTSNGSSAPTWTTPTAYATVTDDTTSNATRYPLFASVTAGNLTTEYVSSTKFQFNPSTGALTATSFSGSASGLTSIPAGQLTGTIPSTVLGNSTLYIGTTAIALNRASASQSLTGVNIDGSAGSATTATTATNATNTAITDNTSSTATWYPTIVSTTTGNLPQTTSSTKLSFVPSTGVLTATSFAGSGSSLTGVVTSVTGTAPIASSGGATPAISISQSTTSTDGYLSSTDWNTFNGKQAPLAKSTSVFTTGSAQTYTAPARTTWVKVTVVGPGGNGGAATGARATGGGGGGVAIKWLSMTAGQTLTYTVGTASGTASSVSSGTLSITTITANSGSNGTSTTYALSITAGGAGGTASGGDVNITGGQGGYSYGSSTTVSTNFGGKGGDCPGFGSGGPALSMVATAGVAGQGYGAGGGGAHGNATAASGTGGVIIFEAY